MKYMELIAPCHFGMEAVLKREMESVRNISPSEKYWEIQRKYRTG